MAYSHDGSIDLAKQIVSDAVESGADAISIHITSMPNYMSLYYKSGKGRVSAGKENRVFYDYLDEISPSFDEWNDVISYVRQFDIDLIVMPNDSVSLDFISTVNPEAYVIPASNFEEYNFIKEVGKRNKKIYLRVGGATIGEIELVIKILNEVGNSDITLLYGHQNYPTKIIDTNIGFIPYLKNLFKLPVGIADHVDADDKFSKISPLLAIPYGITCIEKHLTHDRGKKGEDFEAALNKEEFQSMVENIRKAQDAVLDKGLFEFTKSTDFYKNNLRKRIVAKNDLKAGDIITEDMVVNKRSDYGIFPSEIDSIVGLTLQIDVRCDDGITHNLFLHKNKEKS